MQTSYTFSYLHDQLLLGATLYFVSFLVLAGIKPERIRKRDRIVPSIRIQIHSARQPDGILGQEDPL